MSALPKPSTYTYPTPSKHYSAKQKSLRRKTKQSNSENRASHRTSPISQFPPAQPLPAKLKALLLLQKTSLGLAFVLIASSIAVYISTVRIPELWSKKYQDLETLQRQERELVATNESLKHKLAQQAQQEDSNLILIGSKNTLFITPASLSSPKSNHPQQKLKQINLNKIPMGY
ncbi:MAG: hypothetical protein AB4206_17720 [Xenococcaceae cyanobacterium]